MTLLAGDPPSVLSFPFVAAAIAGAVALISLAVNAIVTASHDRRSRKREAFSRAFEVCTSYAEFPYVVRRRRSSAPEDERIRISEELRKVQSDMAYFRIWLRGESPEVAGAYEDLVSATRRIAGGKIHEAWTVTPIEDDLAMNMPDLGLSELEQYRTRFIEIVRADLHPIRSWWSRSRGSREAPEGQPA